MLGPKALATIPGRGYQFVLTVEEYTPVPSPDTDNRETAFTDVLVLPFTNSSNDPDQEYFADGIKAVDPDDPSIDYNIACAMALLGETETALDTLEDCLPRVDAVTFSVWIAQDNDLDALRELPRFQRLIRDLDARAAAAMA